MKQSQYTEDYLAQTGAGWLITPGTYLAYTLRGRAKRWICRYKESLVRSVCAAGAKPTRSVGGGTAYVLPKAGEV